MWTNENRGRYDRSKLRNRSDLTNEEWALTEPLIPPAKRASNRWAVDARERAPSTGSAAAVDWPRNAQPQGARLPASRLDPPDASVIATLGVSRNCRPAVSWSGFCAPARALLPGFALERTVFLTVLHRPFVSGSDRAADRWRGLRHPRDRRSRSASPLSSHGMAGRGAAGKGAGTARTPFAPRCLKDVVEGPAAGIMNQNSTDSGIPKSIQSVRIPL